MRKRNYWNHGLLALMVIGLVVLSVSFFRLEKDRPKRQLAAAEAPTPGKKSKNKTEEAPGAGPGSSVRPPVLESAGAQGLLSQAKLSGDVQQMIRGIRGLNECYESQACDFPADDPRAYDLAVGQALKRQLTELREAVRRLSARDPQIAQAAREALTIKDGHVKAAALDLLATQNVAPENLAAILENVIAYHDSALVPAALKAIGPYLGSSNEPAIHRAIEKAIAEGGHFISRSLASQIGALVTAKTLPTYRQILDNLPPHHPARRSLSAQLDEVERRLRGG